MLGFLRSKRVAVWFEGPSAVAAHGILDDDIYGLEVRMVIDRSSGEIRSVEGWWKRWTTPECPRAADRLEGALGLRVHEEEISRKLQKRVGRRACRHFANILIECCHSIREALGLVEDQGMRARGEGPGPGEDEPREEDAEPKGTLAVDEDGQPGVVIDLHVHTYPASPCSSAGVDEVLEEAARIGLDGVCLTDHNHVWPLEQVEALRRRHDLLILRGNEITTDQGDILVFGFDEDVKGIIRLEDLRRGVEASGGVMIAAHPFRGFLTFGVDKLGLTAGKAMDRPVFSKVDAVEVLNGKVNVEENRFARRVASGLGLPLTGGSDAHEAAEVGTYATRLPASLRDEHDLIRAIKTGRCLPVEFRGNQER